MTELPLSFDDLARVFETMEEAVIVSDPAGRLQFANATGARLLGFESAESLMRASRVELLSRFELLTPLGAPIPPEELPNAQAAQGRRPPPTELRVRLVPSGEERWASMAAMPLLDAEGKVRLVVTLFREITQERSSERALRLLAEVSALLAESLDYTITLRGMVKRIVPELADWCAVEIFQADGGRDVAAVAHTISQQSEVVGELMRRFPLDPAAPFGSPKVMRTGEPDYVPAITDEQLKRAATDEEHLRLLRALGLRSFMAVPLIARGRTLGVLSVVTGPSNRQLDASTLAVASELAGRAALAVDNARLYERTQAALRLKDEEARTSEALRRLGNSIASELDPVRLAQRICEEATSVCGARLGVFFHQLLDEKGAPQPRFAISGAPPEALGGAPPGGAAHRLPPGQAGPPGGGDGGSPPGAAGGGGGAELPGGAGHLPHWGAGGRPLLRAPRAEHLHRAARAAGDGRGGAGGDRAGERPPLPAAPQRRGERPRQRGAAPARPRRRADGLLRLGSEHRPGHRLAPGWRRSSASRRASSRAPSTPSSAASTRRIARG